MSVLARLQVDDETETRELFRKESGEEVRVRVGGLFGWLRPAIAAPVLAALLLVVCYQSFVTIPKLQPGAAAPTTLQHADFVSLIGANSRSEGASVTAEPTAGAFSSSR